MMRTVFGIDVSKHTINLAIVVNKVKVDELKLTLDRPGLDDLLKLLKSFHQPEVVLKQLVSTPVLFNTFLIVISSTIQCSTP